MDGSNRKTNQNVAVLLIWMPELQHDEGLIEYFHSPESFFGWEVICQALMRRTMQPWLINLSIYRDCSSLCPHASEQWACCCLTFTGAWQCWQLFRSLTLKRSERPGAPGGNESEHESPCWRLSGAITASELQGLYVFWVLSPPNSSGWQDVPMDGACLQC